MRKTVTAMLLALTLGGCSTTTNSTDAFVAKQLGTRGIVVEAAEATR